GLTNIDWKSISATLPSPLNQSGTSSEEGIACIGASVGGVAEVDCTVSGPTSEVADKSTPLNQSGAGALFFSSMPRNHSGISSAPAGALGSAAGTFGTLGAPLVNQSGISSRSLSPGSAFASSSFWICQRSHSS